MNFNSHNKARWNYHFFKQARFGLISNMAFMSSLFTVILLLFISRALWAADTVLEFETQILDLDTGTISNTNTVTISQEYDIRVAYDATRPNHGALVLANPAVGFALLSSTPYANTTLADTIGLSYSRVLNSLPDSSATVIVQTDTGAVYKMGNFVEGTTSVSFDTQLLQ